MTDDQIREACNAENNPDLPEGCMYPWCLCNRHPDLPAILAQGGREMSEQNKQFDLRNVADIDACEADLNAFEASIPQLASAHILPWNMLVGHRRLLIAEARADLGDQP